jgi:flagellar hook-associated protein 3 FlgL
MRVNPLYVSNLVNALNQASATQQNLTQQLSSGRSVNALSDDPVASGQNVLLSEQISSNDTFTHTAASVNSMLQVADTALGSVTTQLNQAISLATSANNGTMNAENLQAVSAQLSGIRDEVVALANTSYLGVYVFSGSNGSAPAFSSATGSYQGSSNVNYLVTPNGQSIQLNVTGDQVFTAAGGDVLGTLNKLIADFSTYPAGATSAADTTQLTAALNQVSGQRIIVGNAMSRLSAAETSAQSQSTQLLSQQTDLIQADYAKIATALSASETQQAALSQVISKLGTGSLFDYF